MVEPTTDPTPEPVQSEPLSGVEEAKSILEKIAKEKEELKVENDRKEKLQSNELLSSTAGSHIEPKPAVEETPKEYRDRIDKEMQEGKHSD